MSSSLETEVTQLHAEICAGLADPSRILILYALSDGPHNVTEICNALEMPQPSVKDFTRASHGHNGTTGGSCPVQPGG